MSDGTLGARIDEVVGRLRSATWKEREGLRDALIALGTSDTAKKAVIDRLQGVYKTLPLEVRWELDEVIEALTPPPAPPEPEPEPEQKAPQRLNPSDLVLTYDDPRGLLLHKTKDGKRWFATQRDPATGQPRTFELVPQEIAQLKTQLAGSPYWLLGSGEGQPSGAR